MPCFISIRDIEFKPSFDGVRIRAWTDVPTHLTIRISSQRPRIHKTTSFIRGLPLMDDVRFCFTVFTEFEQYEDGDTYEHTYWFDDWPICNTRYFYFFGSQAGEVCVSTSSIFEYHNNGVDPVEPPDKMYAMNSIDPQTVYAAGRDAWADLDLSFSCPPGATGAILLIKNLSTTQTGNFGIRKPGTTHEHIGAFNTGRGAWCLAPFRPGTRITETYYHNGPFRVSVMGYTGRQMVYPDNPVSIAPTAIGVWRTIDIRAIYPTAQAVFTSFCPYYNQARSYGIRPHSSPTYFVNSAGLCFPHTNIPVDGKIDTLVYTYLLPPENWLVTAYLSMGGVGAGDGSLYDPYATTGWKTFDMTHISPDARWAYGTIDLHFTNTLVSARKGNGFFSDTIKSAGHQNFIVHCNESALIELYNNNDVDKVLLRGVIC